MVNTNGLSKSMKPKAWSKGTPPAASEIKHNLKTPVAETPKVGIQLKVDPEFRKSFKIQATLEGLLLNEFTEKIYDFYMENRPR